MADQPSGEATRHDAAHQHAIFLTESIMGMLLVMQEDEKSGRDEPGALRRNPDFDISHLRAVLNDYVGMLRSLKVPFCATSAITSCEKSAPSAHELVEAIVQDVLLFVEFLRSFWPQQRKRHTQAKLSEWRRAVHEHFFREHPIADLKTLHASLVIERRSATTDIIVAGAHTSERQLCLVVDLARNLAILDGVEYDISSKRALRWVKVLAANPGEWISSTELESYDVDLISVRTDHLRKYIPPEVLSLIESVGGKGSRLRLT